MKQVQLPTVALFLREANSFVASSYDAFSRSAPHIYISALPFAAKDSLIWQYFGRSCTGIVSVETSGIDRHGQNLVMTLTGHDGPVTSIAYSCNGRNLASVSGPRSLDFMNVSREGDVRVWDTRTGEEVMAPMRVDDEICAIAFSLGDTAVAVCTLMGVVRVRDISTGRDLRCWRCYKLAHQISCAIFSPDGTLIATASDSWKETVHVWSTDTGVHIFALQGLSSIITGIAFSASGRLAAASSIRGTIDVWDSRSGWDIVWSLSLVHNPSSATEVNSFAISPDGNMLAVGLSDSAQIEVWSLDTRSRAYVIPNNESIPSSLAFSLDGSHLAAVIQDRIQFWDWRTRQEAALPLHGHSNTVNLISYSPDGLHIASASEDRTIRIWAVGGNETALQPLPHPSGLTCVALAFSNIFIVSGSDDGYVRVWDLQNGHPKLPPLLGNKGTVVCVAISPNGQLIASASDPQGNTKTRGLPRNRTIRLWDAQTGQPVDDLFEGSGGAVRAVTFSLDVSQLASASLVSSSDLTEYTAVFVWKLTTRKPSKFGTFKQKWSGNSKHWCPPISFSSNGQLLAAAVGGVGELHIWRTSTGRPLGAPVRTGEHPVSVLAFSHDCTKIVMGTLNGTFHVSDVHSGQVVSALTDRLPTPAQTAPRDPPTFDWLVRSPNDRFTAAMSNEIIGPRQRMRLWDTVKPGVVTAVYVNKVGDGAAAFSTDSQSIIIGGADRIIVWDVEAVMALASEPRCDPLAQLLRTGLQEDGWVKGPSGELLLWIPSEYRDYVQLTPCKIMISRYRVVITSDVTGLRYGADWTSCWR